MERSRVWMWTTAIFAGTTCWLLVRSASPTEVTVFVPSPGTASSTAPANARRALSQTASAPEPAPQGSPPVATPAAAAAPQPTPPTATSLESAEGILLRVAASKDPNAWNRAYEAWGPRRSEMIPLVERLIRSGSAATDAGVSRAALFRVYAWLGGRSALPLLEECAVADPANALTPAAAAICIVDDPEAAASLRRLQSLASATADGVDPTLLAQSRSLALHALAREWAENPPPGQPALGPLLRDALWHYGTPQDKEWVWSTATSDDRDRLLSWVRSTSAPPWPDRLRESVRAGLASEDPKRRAIAASRASESPLLFDDEELAHVASLVNEDVSTAAAGSDAQALLVKARAALAQEGARRDRERKLRAILHGL